MCRTGVYREDSQAVQAHLAIIQSVILRMATSSSSCKTWCITLVSAILVVAASKSKPDSALIAAIPAVLFLVLDAYYLAMEKLFRDSYNSLVRKLHEGGLDASDLYLVAPEGSIFRAFARALVSFSIWALYLTLIAMIYVAKVLVI